MLGSATAVPADRRRNSRRLRPDERSRGCTVPPPISVLLDAGRLSSRSTRGYHSGTALRKARIVGIVSTGADVVVVGAGFAGLAAALALTEADLHVIVLEARDRVGGRVFSVRLGNGEIAELGAEWVMPEDGVLEAITARLGLRLVDAGVDYLRRQPRGSRAVGLDEVDGFLAAADDELARAGRTASPLGEVIDRAGGDERARAAVRARLQGTFATDLSGVPVPTAWRFAAPPAVYRRVGGGASTIADAIAGRLADVRLRCRVVRIAASGRGIVVSSDRDEARCSAAIVAVPAPIASEIAFEPSLPAEQRRAFAELPMGVAAKLAVPLATEPPRLAVQCVDLPFWLWTANGPTGTPRRVVTSFAGSELPHVELGIEGGDPSAWVGRILELAPELVPAGEPVMKVWSADALARGAYSWWDERSLARAGVFERMHGRVAFAGEHTARERSGTMDGALRSGARAAAQIVGILRGGDGGTA